MSPSDVTRDGTRWSNAEEDRVAIADYDPAWPARFAEEAQALREAIAGTARFRRIEHFGSTAVEGLAAKPVIDIMVVSDDREAWPRLVAPIEALGYAFWSDNPRTDRMFFVKGMPPRGDRRTHHVHVRTPEDAADALLFRDYLRARPDEAKRYERLKRKLSERHPTEREAYTDGKEAMISRMLARARTQDEV